MEGSILEELEWRPLPHPIMCGLLFSSGLLHYMSERNLFVLEEVIAHCYDHVIVEEICAVLYQVVLMDPAVVALACFHCMLCICMEEDEISLRGMASRMALDFNDGESASLQESSTSQEVVHSLVLAMCMRLGLLAGYTGTASGHSWWWDEPMEQRGHDVLAPTDREVCKRLISGSYYKAILAMMKDFI